jgi:hypothetical protein
MQWMNQLNRFAGVALLLLALGIIVSIASEIAVTDADPFERDELDNFLTDIDENRGLAIIATFANVVTDAFLGVVAAAALYLVFRGRARLLAFLGFALLLAGDIAFIAGDAANIGLIILAEDFVEKGGAGGIAAGDDVILETARAMTIWSESIGQMGVTALAAGLLSLGVLIALSPEGDGPVPPRWIGWTAVCAGLITILSWIGAVSADVGFALAAIGLIATLVFLVTLGVWLIREPDAGQGSGISPA